VHVDAPNSTAPRGFRFRSLVLLIRDNFNIYIYITCVYVFTHIYIKRTLYSPSNYSRFAVAVPPAVAPDCAHVTPKFERWNLLRYTFNVGRLIDPTSSRSFAILSAIDLGPVIIELAQISQSDAKKRNAWTSRVDFSSDKWRLYNFYQYQNCIHLWSLNIYLFFLILLLLKKCHTRVSSECNVILTSILPSCGM